MTPGPGVSGAVCAVHLGNAATGTCQRCGNFVCAQCVLPEVGPWCEKCRLLVGPVAQLPPPWERRAELGFLVALWETWKLSLFSPDRFFRSLPEEVKWVDALWYAWILGALQAGPACLMQVANFEQFKASMALIFRDRMPEWLTTMSPWSFGLLIAVAPMVFYPLSFIISSGLTHLGCLVAGAGNKGWAMTARAQGYSQGPVVAVWIPLIGPLLGIYVLVLTIFGIARGHQVHGGRATVGVLILPVLLGCCLGAGLVVAMVSALSRVH